MTRFASRIIGTGLVVALLVSCGTDDPAGISEGVSVTVAIGKQAAIEPDHYTISVQGDGVAVDTTGASGDTVWFHLSSGTYQFEIHAYDASDRLCGAASFSYDVVAGTHVIPVTLRAVPEIVDEPDDVAVTAGESASFAVAADGSDLEYQWQRDGADIAGATDSVYVMASVVDSDSGATMRCIVTNPIGADTSREALLEVVANVSAPGINVEPTDVRVEAGDSATFTVSAEGQGLAYQWQRDGVNILGAEEPTYALRAAVSDDGALFRCIVTNSAGADTSREALLQVSDTSGPEAPRIESDPLPATTIVGETATFSVSASGTDISYVWQRNGADIASADNSEYSFVVSAGDDDTRYRCIVTNSAGSDTSAEALLRVFEADSVIDTLRVTDVDTLTDIRPYHITGAIIVEQGGMLVIEAGAYIKMGTDVEMTVSGELRCEGTPSSIVTFTAYDTTAPWAFIELTPEAVGAEFDGAGTYQSGCMLRHSVVECASDYGLYVSGTSVLADHCTFRYNGVGVYQGGQCTSRFEDCTVLGNEGHGMQLNETSSTGGGFDVVLLRSIFAHNGDRGIEIVRVTDALMDSCEIYGNLGGGIRLYRNEASTVRSCVIRDNHDQTWPEDGGGIHLQHGKAIIRDNAITGNMADGMGGGIFRADGASERALIVGNFIARNSAARSGGAAFQRPDSIAYNTFHGNECLPEGDSCAISFHHKILLDDPEVSFMHNNVIEHEVSYAVRNTNEEDGRELNLRGNWWGTTVENEIDAMIYDHADSTFYQQSDYSGYLDAPESGAPPIP
jgi:hypothetical protein